MGNNAVEKVMKLLTPLSCEDVRERFDLLAQTEGELSEEGEWVQEHLLVCDDCLATFTNTVKAQVGQGNLREAWVENVPMPLSPSAGKTLGVLWDQVKHFAAQGVDWAKEQLDETRRCIQGTMRLRQMVPAGVGPDLGQKGLGPAMMGHRGALAATGMGIAAEVVDENWKPQGTIVPFEVKEGPVITHDGRFLLTLYTPDTRWQGARMLCTLLLVEGQRASFESHVETDPSGSGGQVRFIAEGLPSPGVQQLELPLEVIHLSLIASH